MRQRWNLVTYDISSPKRLSRVHRLLTKKGIAVQKSVFLFRGTNRGLSNLMTRMDELIDADHDDVRVYPVAHPARFWSSAQISHALPETEPQNKASIRDRVANWFFGQTAS